MASPGPTESAAKRWLPFLGVLQLDLHGMIRSRILLGWLIVTALVAAAALANAVEKSVPAAVMLRNIFNSYIVVWSTVVIVLTAGAVSGESGVVADSILSRGITRHAYILSKYLSRLLTINGVCLLVIVPISYLATVHLSNPPSPKALLLCFSYVFAHLFFLTMLGVTFSIWFDRALVSIAVLWVLVYFFGAICSALDLAFLAPARMLRNMAEALGGYDAPDAWKVWLGFGLPAMLLGCLGTFCFTRRDV